MTETASEGGVRNSADFRTGFWRRHFSGGLLVAFCVLLSLAVLPAALRRDSREDLVKVDGHITGLRYFPAAGPGGGGRIEFNLEEIEGTRFRAEKLKEADELLFVTREKADSYIDVFVESEKWTASPRPAILAVIGLKSSRGVYLSPPNIAAALSTDRIGATVLIMVLFAVMAATGFRLRTAWQSEVKADPKTLDSEVDAILAEVATWPLLDRWNQPLLVDARRVDEAEEARKKSSRVTIEKASNKPMRAVEMLIRSGADLNAQNGKGQTPLILAAKSGSLEAVQALLKSRANPNLTDQDGWTALMHAADQGELGICQRLLESGAAVTMQRKDGKTAMDLAEASQKKNPALIEALRRAASLAEASERAKSKEPTKS